MIRVALRGLAGRKLRASLTAIAVVLGVAMISGTFVLTDSIDKAFDSIFTDTREGSNVVVSGKAAFDLGDQSGSTAPSFDQSLLQKVRSVPDVAEAEGSVDGEAQLIGDDGKAIVYGGAPNLGFSIANGASPFNPLELVTGDWPKADHQVVVDSSMADKEHFAVGDVVGVQTTGPEQRFTISGIVKFKSDQQIGGATMAGFDLPTAQRVFGKPGQLDEIAMSSKPGVSDQQLLAEVEKILPPGTQARTASAQAKEDASDVNGFISFLRSFLLAFGGVALFVGSFVIANSLSITIAQRTREFATLRTVGASRRQVLLAIIVESIVVGVVASIVGLFLGLGLASGLFELFDAVGFTLPNSGLVFGTRTVVVALLVGVLVTLAASLRPAIRATRVPPIAAVREGATLPESRFARFRTPFSVALIVLGFGGLAIGLFAPGLGTTQILIWIGIGALLVFFGVALFSARIARPLATIVSPIGKWVVVVLSALVWPFWTLPYWLLRYGAFTRAGFGRRAAALVGGAVLNPLLALIVLAMWLRTAVTSWQPEWPVDFPGVVPDRVTTQLAEDNARRNPQRTASTASALMIGLALVTLVGVLAAGITTTFRSAVEDIWRNADYAITAQNNFSPIPTAVADAAAKAPEVESVASVRTGDALAFGHRIFATAVSPEAEQMFNIDWTEGTNAVLGSLGADGAFTDKGYAKTHSLTIGSPVTLTFANGKSKRFTIKGVFDPPAGGSPFGPVTISSATWDSFNENPKNLYSFVLVKGGQSDANLKALESTLADFPNAKVATRDQFIDNQISGLNSILNILYVLLALSVVVSLFGIVNTLVLTVFERTREIGMLRAIGVTRRQIRRMVRAESVITALIGGVLGIVLGVVLGGLLVARVDFIEFTLPIGRLLVFAIAAIIVGIVAAIFPARRAARLNVLEALHYE
jgi:ABC-type antimicrobial peptide transport system permease subunit